ncbi:MAG TPA: SDR family NAD(P)-dependent oxidoreductase [Deltaproteobacteria bacterium]|nr:SDR family NAD(P)-dependent oxidoreductase [Deltaproteobacteria bacterium]
MASVLVIGATSAIAGAVLGRLAARGDRLYLVARDEERLAALVESLGPAVVGAEARDLVRLDEPGELVARAVAALGQLDVAWICHGWLPDQRTTEQDPAVAAEALQVNLLSVIALLLPLANHMEAQAHGTLAVITSVAGMRGRPRNYTYGAAKAGLSTYLRGLRSRLWPVGVRVVDLRPGPVITPMTEGHPRNLLFTTPEAIAPAIVAALDRGPPVVFLPWFWGPLMAIITRLPEPVFQRLGVLAGR